MPQEAMSAEAGALHAIELKGRMMLVSILHLRTADTSVLEGALASRMAEAPDLMRDMPVVVDLESIAALGPADLLVALERVRAHGFKLIGLVQGSGQVAVVSEASGLPTMVLGAKSGSEPLRRARPPEPAPAVEAPAADPPRAPAPAAHTPTRLVSQPVRSGQQIYARGGDLIVTGSVSAGAEVLADGHIHIYGALRGRALAGVRGLESARIFCRRLDAELVSVAGHYRIAEDILDSERGENRVVTLAGDLLRITEI